MNLRIMSVIRIKLFFLPYNRIPQNILKVINFGQSTNFYYLKRSTKYVVGDNLCDFLVDVGTVSITMIQAAIQMGYEEIYLIGIDNSINKYALMPHPSQNQKQDQYFEYKEWNKHYLQLLKKHSEEVSLFNATRGGFLEIFTRIDFDRLFNS